MNRFRNRVSRHAALTILSITVVSPLMAAAVFGQSEQSQESSPPAAGDVASLLTQARQAMASNKLQEANALVRRAEATRVRYPVLHFGDTPARVRGDLNKLLALHQGDQTTSKKNKKTSV